MEQYMVLAPGGLVHIGPTHVPVLQEMWGIPSGLARHPFNPVNRDRTERLLRTLNELEVLP